ncbi:hypothetical protein OAO01_07255 [Oligoflexia bacterium]|nr:hypothetical protein [Oligoflexia bacterium]
MKNGLVALHRMSALISLLFLVSTDTYAESGTYIGGFLRGTIIAQIDYSRAPGSNTCSLSVSGPGGASAVTAQGTAEDTTSETGKQCTTCKASFTASIKKTFGLNIDAKCSFIRCKTKRALSFEENAIVCEVEGELYSTDLQEIIFRQDFLSDTNSTTVFSTVAPRFIALID